MALVLQTGVPSDPSPLVGRRGLVSGEPPRSVQRQTQRARESSRVRLREALAAAASVLVNLHTLSTAQLGARLSAPMRLVEMAHLLAVRDDGPVGTGMASATVSQPSGFVRRLVSTTRGVALDMAATMCSSSNHRCPRRPIVCTTSLRERTNRSRAFATWTAWVYSQSG